MAAHAFLTVTHAAKLGTRKAETDQPSSPRSASLSSGA